MSAYTRSPKHVTVKCTCGWLRTYFEEIGKMPAMVRAEFGLATHKRHYCKKTVASVGKAKASR